MSLVSLPPLAVVMSIRGLELGEESILSLERHESSATLSCRHGSGLKLWMLFPVAFIDFSRSTREEHVQPQWLELFSGIGCFKDFGRSTAASSHETIAYFSQGLVR